MKTSGSLQTALRSLPGVDSLLSRSDMDALVQAYGRELVTHAVRRCIDRAREQAVRTASPVGIDAIADSVRSLLFRIADRSLKPVINATGILLHTNLGRAPLGRQVLSEVSDIAGGYSNLEFDLAAGSRGNRSDHLRDLLAFSTGAEDAIIVNNNAAGVMLVLNTLSKDQEVIISRGELIEIGGSFRIPDIMKASGAVMREVGTTNRTRLADYEEAVTPQTRLIFKAHTSNYTIRGFAEDVAVKDIAELSRKHGLVCVYDIGSGLLAGSSRDVLRHEPDVRSALADKADLVLFSCDKLLGGPQAGIVAGRKDLVTRLAKAPMMRTLRIDKLRIAALHATLRQYLREEDLYTGNPFFYFIGRMPDEILARARELESQLQERGIAARVVDSSGQCGGGTVPDVQIQSHAVELAGLRAAGDVSPAERVFRQLLQEERPVLGVLRQGCLVLDMLAVFPEDIPVMADTIAQAVAKHMRTQRNNNESGGGSR